MFLYEDHEIRVEQLRLRASSASGSPTPGEPEGWLETRRTIRPGHTSDAPLLDPAAVTQGFPGSTAAVAAIGRLEGARASMGA